MRLYHDSAFDFSRTADSHWEASAEPLGRELARLEGSVRAEVAVIGAGYTGLNAALVLARSHGMDVAVIDAGPVGWGASGRNGGFCTMGSAKLGYGAMIGKFGLEGTRQFFRVQRAAVEHVAALIERYRIDADRTGSGELELAHRPNRVKELIESRDFLAGTFGAQFEFIDAQGLAGRGAASPAFHGGLKNPVGFGLHPLKYVRGLARAALDHGVRIYPSSAVEGWREEGGRHVLSTAQGEASAAKVLVATNGYTDDRIPPAAGGRLLPALSSIMVTRPLSDAELAAQGWTTHDLAYDTRNLLHYFRLLPCRRFLFGGRGGTDASPPALAAIGKRIRRTFETMFPAWAKVETERSWSGFVCLSFNRIPFAGPLPGLEEAWMAAAYHGGGVAMGSYAGARIADLIAGRSAARAGIPVIMQTPLKRFPLPTLRRYYLKAAYVGFGLKDEWF